MSLASISLNYASVGALRSQISLLERELVNQFDSSLPTSKGNFVKFEKELRKSDDNFLNPMSFQSHLNSLLPEVVKCKSNVSQIRDEICNIECQVENVIVLVREEANINLLVPDIFRLYNELDNFIKKVEKLAFDVSAHNSLKIEYELNHKPTIERFQKNNDLHCEKTAKLLIAQLVPDGIERERFLVQDIIKVGAYLDKVLNKLKLMQDSIVDLLPPLSPERQSIANERLCRLLDQIAVLKKQNVHNEQLTELEAQKVLEEKLVELNKLQNDYQTLSHIESLKAESQIQSGTVKYQSQTILSLKEQLIQAQKEAQDAKEKASSAASSVQATASEFKRTEAEVNKAGDFAKNALKVSKKGAIIGTGLGIFGLLFGPQVGKGLSWAKGKILNILRPPPTSKNTQNRDLISLFASKGLTHTVADNASTKYAYI